MYEPYQLPVPSPKSGKRKINTKHSPVNKDPNGPKKPSKTHYLAAKMGLDTSKKAQRLRKKCLSPDLTEVPSFEINLGYEHRTVNSIADDTEFGDDAPVPRKRRRKPEYIDSEVDLMRTPEARPPLDMSLLMPRHTLTAIEEHVSENELAKAPKNRRKKLKKISAPTLAEAEGTKATQSKVKRISPNMSASSPASGSLNSSDKYPVLNDQDLVKRFLKVEFTNNQKGRIRQVLKDILRGTSSTLMPEVINNKIQAILKSSDNLTDTDLRKIRVLYNMLKKTTEDLKKPPEITDSEEIFKDQSKETKKSKEINIKEENNSQEMKSKEGKTTKKDKPKKKAVKEALGFKRYVVFVGNLPLNVTKEQILNHFAEIRDFVRDVRIPQLADDKKSSYAYVEFDNAPVYEMALSKHHSMMGSKRINVLYTSPNKKSKITKTEAKAKSAKLVAMAKKGTLIGSVPMQRKRSHRRAKARAFQKAAEKQMDAISKK